MQLLNASSEHNGHIPRNVRLSLMSIDMVQPYVCIKHVASLSLSHHRSDTDCGQIGNATTQLERDDVAACRLALTRPNGSTHEERRLLSELPPSVSAAAAAAAMSPIEVVWYVGGSSVVDCTFLSWHMPDPDDARSTDPTTTTTTTIDWMAYLDSLLHSQSSEEAFRAFCSRNYSDDTGRRRPLVDLSFPLLASTAPHRGASRWGDNSTLFSSDTSAPIDNPSHVFTSSPVLPIYDSKLFPPGRYWLVAWAMTDQHYGAPHQGYPFDRKPQSHLANVRTNAHWYKQVNSRVARGRLLWPSDPIEVVVTEGSYVVRAVTADCAWWDRTTHVSHDSTSRALPAHTTSSTDPVRNRNPIDSSPPMSMQDSSWTGASNALTGALVLIVLLICCALRMGTQWRQKNRIFSSIATNNNNNNNRLFSNPRFSRLPSKPVS